MDFRCGIDIIYIPGIAEILKDELLLKKFFHASELSNTKAEHLAGVIAAKEAFFKALGVVPKFQDIEITYEPSGRPQLVVAPQWRTYKSADVSISHDNDYAVAMVILAQ